MPSFLQVCWGFELRSPYLPATLLTEPSFQPLRLYISKKQMNLFIFVYTLNLRFSRYIFVWLDAQMLMDLAEKSKPMPLASKQRDQKTVCLNYKYINFNPILFVQNK